MNEKMKMLLRLMLEEEEQTEAGQKAMQPKNKKMEPVSRRPNPPQSSQRPFGLSARQNRELDMQQVPQEMYTEHEVSDSGAKNVPIWEKYALTVPEAALYFHLGEGKLREIVKRDRYAKYLVWNKGRVYIKRKLFEEYLDNECEV